MLKSQHQAPSPYPEALAEWIELDGFRRPRPLRARRKWFTLAAVAAAATYAGWTALPRHHAAHEAAPVASAHAGFNAACTRCHVESFQPLARLVHGDAVRSVPNHACLVCHDGAAHHPSRARTPDCAECHREHRGKASLARGVADGHCTACHADLPANAPAHGQTAFAAVSDFASDHPEFRAARPGAQDPGRLRFNHARHLGLDLKALRAHQAPGLEGLGDRLECAACHQPDAARRFMQPISYARHCAGCHPLNVGVVGRFADERARAAAEAFARVPAPHQEPAVVRAVLRERFLRFIQDNPVVLDPKQPTGPPRPLPGKGPRPVREGEWLWVKGQLAEAERLLFVARQLPNAERVLFGAGGGCGHCHVPAEPARSPDGLPRYRATDLPRRWFPHSSFRHESHRLLTCLACHGRATTSQATRDVLMPAIASCRQCHSPAGGVRAGCADCHTYHDRARERGLNGALTIEQFLRNKTFQRE